MAILPFFKERPCSVKERLTKGTFLAMLSQDSRTQEFFLGIPDDDWIISSFDPNTRDVCVEITTPHGRVNTVSVKLNHLAPTVREERDTTQGNRTTQTISQGIPVTSTELLAQAIQQPIVAIDSVGSPVRNLTGGVQSLPNFSQASITAL